MSNRPRGFVGYGYSLGGSNNEWHFENVDADGYATLPWYDERSENHEDFPDALHGVLLKRHGLQKYDEHKLPVRLEYCGSWDFAEYMLIHPLSYQSVEWSEVTDLNLYVDSSYDIPLREALATLGLTPTVRYPRWLLGCFYG